MKKATPRRLVAKDLGDVGGDLGDLDGVPRECGEGVFMFLSEVVPTLDQLIIFQLICKKRLIIFPDQ